MLADKRDPVVSRSWLERCLNDGLLYKSKQDHIYLERCVNNSEEKKGKRKHDEV